MVLRDSCGMVMGMFTYMQSKFVPMDLITYGYAETETTNQEGCVDCGFYMVLRHWKLQWMDLKDCMNLMKS